MRDSENRNYERILRIYTPKSLWFPDLVSTSSFSFVVQGPKTKQKTLPSIVELRQSISTSPNSDANRAPCQKT